MDYLLFIIFLMGVLQAGCCMEGEKGVKENVY